MEMQERLGNWDVTAQSLHLVGSEGNTYGDFTGEFNTEMFINNKCNMERNATASYTFSHSVGSIWGSVMVPIIYQQSEGGPGALPSARGALLTLEQALSEQPITDREVK